MEDCTEIIDFGPHCGKVNVIQLAGDVFHKACLQTNSFNADNTGLRMHGGAHVAIRFLLLHPHLIENFRLCEVGCGTGVFGLIGTRGGEVSSHLVLTDGNGESVEIASKNALQLVASSNATKISFGQLFWGCSLAIERLLGAEPPKKTSELTSEEAEVRTNEQPNESGKINNVLHSNLLSGAPSFIRKEGSPFFDVVIGCELFYYRTSVQDLLYTVLQLTDSSGIFIHSHVFRRQGQDMEMIEYLGGHGWITAEIPVQLFIDSDEFEHHPEWYGVHCLVSGPSERIQALLIEENRRNSNKDARGALSCNYHHLSSATRDWKIFCGIAEGLEESDSSKINSAACDIDDGMAIANLFARSL